MSRKVEYTSLGGRLKKSLAGVLVGGILFLASFVLLFWNEGRAVRTARGLEEGQAVCVEAAPDRLDSGNNGKLVHLSGPAVTDDVLKDARFGVSASALILERSVSMYQWIEHEKTKTEKQLGGGEKKITTYSYTKAWDRSWHDSGRFHDPQSPPNPPMSVTSTTWTARPVTVGVFTLPQNMVAALGADQELEPGGAEMPAGGQYKIHNGDYYLGADPASPQIGDMRVSFRVRRPGDVSLLARANGTTFEPYITGQNTTISVIKPGVLSAGLMFQQEMAANTMLTWILRAAGWAAMAVGLMLILGPLATLSDVVPMIGNVVGAGIGVMSLLVSLSLSLLTIGVAWVTYRPVVGGALLAGGMVVFLLLRKRRKRGR